MDVSFETIFSPGALVGHLSYFLLVLSMMMTSLTWLRVVSISAGLTAIWFEYFMLSNAVGVFWNAMFVAANVFQLTWTTYRNRMARFSPEERLFCETAVPGLAPAACRALLTAGEWHDAPAGRELTHQGKLVPALVFLTEGETEIIVDDHPVARSLAPTFVGEISISLSEPAIATVVAAGDIRFLSFERERLQKLFRRNPDLRQALEAGFNRGLRRKLEVSNAEIKRAGGSAG